MERSDSGIGGFLAEASERSGLDDFGDEWFHGPLSAYALDLRSEPLTAFGREFLRNLAVRDLVRRQKVLELLGRYPEIGRVPIPPIVYITGLERSGTTLLHNLVSLHRDARALLRWELMEPLPPPQAETFATDERIARVQRPLDRLRGSMLERMHWVNADEPEECPWGFIDCVGMLGQAVSMCLPRWRSFLLERDLSRAYEHYRQVVQILLWKNPVPRGGFLVLKAPQIARSIDQFAAVFPEARFVITDRDPFRAMASTLVMVESIVDPFCRVNPVSDDAHRSRIGLSHLHGKLPRLSEFTERDSARARHVPYSQLVRDSATTVVSLLEELGVASDPGHVTAIEEFLAAQRAGRRARPPAQLATLGYDHDSVLADPVVAAYCSRYGIEAERTRLTGARSD